ncbi:MAG TPA: VWA domain-containing protein [Acidobacteriaceae bacterium]|nr:VWA domain-containing protein [Acidobacteriaceae bacterium]
MTTGVVAGWMLLCAPVVVQMSAQQAAAPAQAAPAQAAPAAAAAAQATGPALQKQTQLNVDSDPVPSPDPDTKTAAPVKGPPKAGEITKENGRYTLRTNAYEVRLNASVIDSSGQAVENLTQDAFHVYEDGVPQTIIGFRHEDVPVSLGILIDSSGSMYDKRAAVDAASLDLVRLSNRQDEAFLVDFSSEAYIDQDFTSSIDKLQQGLAYIKSSGGTAMYDAVIASADYLSKNAKRSKQVLLIVTDGDDNASSGTLEQTIRRVQDLDGPAIYCIGLLFGEDVSHSEARHSREVLTELSAQTGGQAYFPRSLKDVDGIAREVAQDIRQQYTIEYRSTKSPELGGYRQIHVEAKEKGFRGLQVRTRPGYFPKVAGAGGGKSETSGN